MKKHFAKQIFAAALAISFVCGLSACREREEEQLSLKPVIYLYPEEETDVSVTLAYDGTLTCTYPNYKTGWHVSAKPDGTLTDEDGQTYNYLYGGKNIRSCEFYRLCLIIFRNCVIMQIRERNGISIHDDTL